MPLCFQASAASGGNSLNAHGTVAFPEHIAGKQDPNTGSFNTKPVGTGPYFLSVRSKGTQVIGERLVRSSLLCAVSFLVAVLAGTLLGVLAARRPGS